MRCLVLAIPILHSFYCILKAEELLEELGGDRTVPLVTRAGTETWQSVMVIDEGHAFEISSNENGEGVAREFRFFVKQATGRVTPFVARLLDDNAFQVQAVGKTRIAGIDYTRGDVGKLVAFPFTEEAESVLVKDGWVAGFISANANGTDAGTPPIPFDDDGNEVWISGGESPSDSGNVRRKAAPKRGTNLVLDARRTYAFQISVISAKSEPAPPCELNTVSQFIPAGAAQATEVNRIVATDANPGDVLKFSLVSGDGDADNRQFSIEGSSLIAIDDLSGEIRDYQLRISATDAGGGSFEKAIVLGARPFVAPTGVAIDSTRIPLGSRAGRRVAFLSADDPNSNDFGDWHTFKLVTGDGDTHNDMFAIFEDKLLWVGDVPEPGHDYAIRIRATDRNGLFLERPFELSGEPLSQGLIGNEVTGRKTSRSDSTPAFYTNFSAMPSNGIVNAVEIYFQGQKGSQTFRMLQLRPLPSEDLEVIFDSGEISPRGLQDEPVRLPFPNGPTNVRTGDIFAHLGRGIPLNIGGVSVDTGDNFFPVFVPTGDVPAVGSQISFPSPAFPVSSGPWRDYAWAVHFSPTEPLGPTSILVEPAALSAGAPAGSVVARLSAHDPNPDEAHRFQLVTGTGDTDNGLFEIEDDVLSLRGNAPSTGTELSLRVEVTDSDDLKWSQSLRMNVLQPQPPTAIRPKALALLAQSAPGSVVSRLLADDANSVHGDLHTFELVNGFGDDDNDIFAIEGDRLMLARNIDPGQEAYKIRVAVTDSTNLSFATSVTLPVAQLLGSALGPREVDEDSIDAVFYTNFLEVPEPGIALGVSRWNQSTAGEFSIVQLRVTDGSNNVYDVIHSSGGIEVFRTDVPGVVHDLFATGPSRVEPGDLFGSYGNGLSYSERSASSAEFTPIYWAPLRPTRPNIITLGSPAFRTAPLNARNYAWAVQWLPDSVDDFNSDKDGDGLPDDWEQETFGGLGQLAYSDPDGDEMANLLEYYAQTNPLTPSVPRALSVSVTPEPGAPTTITYQARALPGIVQRLSVEWSPDLETWSRLDLGLTVVRPAAAGSSTIETTLPTDLESNDGIYLRLRATP